LSTQVKTASVLAFERKLDPSDALFFAGTWDTRQQSSTWQTVSVREKSVRGTISNRLKGKEQDPAKLDAEIQKANLQTVDVATLPPDADTLKVQFSLRILGGVGIPSACNNAEYQAKLVSTVKSYVSQHGFGELAKRYAYNLANGRFLWRNRVGAEKVDTVIAHEINGISAKVWTFDALCHSLRNFETTQSKSSLEELSQLIESGLNDNAHVLLNVIAFVRIGAGQEVFPSQELILDRGRGDKSRTLYHVNNVAAIHSQKIGNAIRTIDTWYPSAESCGPIAIEPYGSVTTLGKAFRQPKDKVDFYSLLDDWVVRDKTPDLENQLYVTAVLIRGGVFGEKE
jgi:CRISPR-associated protein Csy3